MGILINITFDDSDVERITDGAIRRMQDMTPAMRDIGEHMLASTAETFEAGGRPVKWKRSYRSKLTGDPTLVDTRHLMGSIDYDAFPDHVEIGTNVRYARIHQLGGVIRPVRAKALKFRLADGAWRSSKQVTIPARPFLLVQDEDREYFHEAIRAYILGD